MAKRSDLGTQSRNDAAGRKPWATPAVQKIAAGEAEVGTRSAPDGAFTTS